MPFVLALLLGVPAASAIVLPNILVTVDLDGPTVVQVGRTATYTAWVGTDQDVVSLGLPMRNVTLEEAGAPVAHGISDLNGLVRFTRTYATRGSFPMNAYVREGNYVQDTFFPAYSPSRVIQVGERPGAPAVVVASPGPESDEVVLAWSAPADDGGLRVQRYWHSVAGSTGIVEAATRAVVREGLTPGQTYTLSVRAENALGPGPWTDVVFTLPSQG